MPTLVSRLALVCTSLLALTLTLSAGAQSTADTSTFSSSNLGAYPPNIGYGTGGPMMMLTASKDHTLFSPIYTDYEDIDGDGTDDYTFKPTFRYYGYFDSSKCYLYKAGHNTGGRFEPEVMASVVGTGAAARYTCPHSKNYWSGNFLNWATMTRIDVVRKTLYGGFRREDTPGDTTLEMAQMSQDAHSFVKYYSGADVRDYTPYDATEDLGNAGLTICNRGSKHALEAGEEETVYPVIRVAKGNYSLWGTTPKTVCNWRGQTPDFPDFSFGAKITAFYNKYGPNQGKALTDPTEHRSLLPALDQNAGKKDTSDAELAVRVQACKTGLIGQERCRVYRDPTVANAPTVYKPIGLLQEFGTTQQSRQPARAEFGLITGSYDQNLRGGALRKNIASMNDEVDFATGRFCHNLSQANLPANCRNSAGIVRSFDRISLFDQGKFNATAPVNNDFALPSEISNGNFASWGNPMSEMVVQALSYFAGQNLGTEAVNNWARDAGVGLPTAVSRLDPLDDTVNDRVAQVTRRELYGRAICRPMHMLAISSGTVSYDTDEPKGAVASIDPSDIYDDASGFMRVNGAGAASTVSSLTNSVGVIEGIQGTARSVGSAIGGFGADCTSKVIGDVQSRGLADVAGVCPEAPGIKGSYLGAGAAFLANTHAIRELGGDTRTSALTPNTGSTVARSLLPAHALRVKSYAASLAGGVARIEVAIPGPGNRKVYITPESSWDFSRLGKAGTTLMPGAMLTFKALYSTSTFGSYVVTWNDAQFGGDYDMDLVGFIRWELSPVAGSSGGASQRYQLKVYTDVLGQEAGAPGAHGFSIIGTVQQTPGSTLSSDGRYLTHGGVDYDAADSDCAGLGRNSMEFNLRCRFEVGGMPNGTGGRDGYAWPSPINNGANMVDFIDKVVQGGSVYTTTVVKTFEVDTGAAQVTLRDPLWYIAKYGSFDTGEKNFSASTTAKPDTFDGLVKSRNWDQLDNSGAVCASGECPDGEPDGYFLARRPELLESRLRTLLERITQGSNSSPAVSTSQLISSSLKYTAEFSQDGFGGALRAYKLSSQGSFLPGEFWNASKTLAAGPRNVITNDASGGLVFDTVTLNATDKPGYRQALSGLIAGTVLTDSEQALVDERVDALINYLRGDQSKEGAFFRAREKEEVLGPIVNSTPWLQDRLAGALFTDADFPTGSPSYRDHVIRKSAFKSLIWVGANDGMLHAFDANEGTPVISYVPSPLAGRLSAALDVSNTSAVALMDGNPFTGDVLVGTGANREWATYLFASLGRGGKAVFALDVTDPAELNEANAASVFKWMFTSADDADLGYQLQDVVRHPASGQATPIVHLNNGEFGLLVPNGYRSANARPALFILSVSGPGSTGWKDALGNPVAYRKLVARAADANNGLMGAVWVDLDNNGTADVVYATDLLGQLWKFDIRSSDPDDWGSALMTTAPATGSGQAGADTMQPLPLFTARDSSGAALPITTAPVAFFPGFGGTMISFGTGRAIEGADFPDTTTIQRFFTVWDKGRYPGDQINPPIEAAEGQQAVENALPDSRVSRVQNDVPTPTFVRRILRRDPVTREVYQIQVSATGEPVLQNQQEVRLGADDVTQRFDPAVHDGWFMDFPAAGEAVISSPVRRLGYVMFTTVRPLSQGEGEQSCSMAPQGALFAFNPVNGLPIRNLFSVGSFFMGNDVKDQRVIGVTTTLDGKSTTAPEACVAGTPGCVCDAAGQNCVIPPVPACGPGKIATRVIGTNGTEESICTSASSLRIQWREIPGMRTRGTDTPAAAPPAAVE